MSERPQNVGIKAIELYVPSQVSLLACPGNSNNSMCLSSNKIRG